MNENRIDELLEIVLHSGMEVHRELGSGLLEICYRNALRLGLEELGLSVESEVEYPVYYHRRLVGQYYADLVVENQIIIECKSARCLVPKHYAQLYHYLRISGVETGLLLNFGEQELIWRKLRK